MDFKLKKCVFVCAAGLLAAALPSCSNEDEESGGTISYGKLASEVPPVANAGIQFPVTGIYHGYNSGFGNSSLGQAYTYRDGRMTGGYERLNDEVIEITSNPLTVRISRKTSYIEEVEEYKNIKVNSDGFITSCECEYHEIDEDEDYMEHYTYTLAYDSEGHRILEKYHLTDVDGYWENGTTTYTWEDGNLIKTEWVWESSDHEDEEGVDWRYTEEMTYDEDETRYPNTGVWHFYDLGAVGNDAFYDAFLYAGLLGRPTKNIPLTFKESQYFDEDYYVYTTTGVNYNQDGSIESIHSIYDRTSSWGGNSTGASSHVYFRYGQEWDEDWTSFMSQRLTKSLDNGVRKPRKTLSPRKRLKERMAQRMANLK